MSTTTSPVTQSEEVAVNRQDKKLVEVLLFVDIGNISKNEPTSNARKKLPIII